MIQTALETSGGVNGLHIAVVVAGYAITLLCSGYIVRFFTPPPPAAEEKARTRHQGRFDPSTVIGKSENILAVTLVLAGEVTGLALLFAAKSRVRKEDIRKNSQCYLGGMLVNLTWSVGMGYLMQYLLRVL